MKPRILVAPLDWGWGHTTRCFPIMQELLNQGAEPWFAGTPLQKELLQKDFSAVSFLDLEGYNVRYSTQGKNLPWKILAQTPGLLERIKKENKWLHDVNKTYHFQGLISDNRFGLYHESIKTVFLTHQLAIRTGLGSWANYWVNRQNRKSIARFDECWIPDWEGEQNLGGELSHPRDLPKNARFIGPLSRLEKVNTKESVGVLVILSGPEPQRTIFEKKILAELRLSSEQFVLVRGKADNAECIQEPNGRIVNSMGSAELSKNIAAAEMVICRSGYSSIMDLVKLGKRMILVPTPGQAEQEYLLKYMEAQQLAVGSSQDDFDLKKLLSRARQFQYKFFAYEDSLLPAVIREWLRMVNEVS